MIQIPFLSWCSIRGRPVCALRLARSDCTLRRTHRRTTQRPPSDYCMFPPDSCFPWGWMWRSKPGALPTRRGATLGQAPHEFMNAVTSASNKRFVVGTQSLASPFLGMVGMGPVWARCGGGSFACRRAELRHSPGRLRACHSRRSSWPPNHQPLHRPRSSSCGFCARCTMASVGTKMAIAFRARSAARWRGIRCVTAPTLQQLKPALRALPVRSQSSVLRALPFSLPPLRALASLCLVRWRPSCRSSAYSSIHRGMT